MPKSLLQKQADEAHFSHAIAYVRNEAHGLKKLHTSELARLNQILTGNNEDPWRFTQTKIQLPTGHIEEMSMIENPMAKAREILGDTHQLEANDKVSEAALSIYTRLVTAHLFNDANRRTAALAAYWVLESHNQNVDPHAIVKIPVGNLRDHEQLSKFSTLFTALIQKSDD